MTTKPRARKFRIRRPEGMAQTAEPRATATQRPAPAPQHDDLSSPLFSPTEDGFGSTDAFPGSAAYARQQSDTVPDDAPPPRPQTVEDELSAIRQEGLTGRQLRMARRAAQKNGLNPSSDFDAVRILRQRGVDPFARTSMLELVVSDRAKGSGNAARQDGATPNLPAMAPGVMPMPTPTSKPAVPDRFDAEGRAAEIMKVQRDVARRRRKRLILLGARLMFFVMLPTLIVGYYYYRVATPLYATHTQFLIQKADSGASSSGGGGIGGLLGGGGFATVQESITVQSYLESREAMLRLDDELGFRAHFSADRIDPLARLAPDATDEAMYDTYRRHLVIGYDPTEGLVKLEVIAADAATSQQFSEALIRYSEERVDQMSERLRVDQMAGAIESFDDAEIQVSAAQERVLQLQEQRGVLSAEAEVSSIFGQISGYEREAQEERLRLAELNTNARPNATRVEVAERNIARLEELIGQLRAGLTDTETGTVSLARIQSELIVAQADLETRQMMLAQALQSMESARTEANRQSLYLSIGVFPIAPDEAAYPRAFENTLLAFLIFSGVYLLVSMTASILREQVSS